MKSVVLKYVQRQVESVACDYSQVVSEEDWVADSVH